MVIMIGVFILNSIHWQPRSLLEGAAKIINVLYRAV